MRLADLVTINEVTKSIAEWAWDYGIYPRTIFLRIGAGWTAQRAITTPVRYLPGRQLNLNEMPRIAKQSTGGVLANIADGMGTGGGCIARDSAQIDFSQVEPTE